MIDFENKEFEERADFIDQTDLLNWTVNNDYFQNIQKKLIEKGAKLVVGPRGTGKTHQFRHAYFDCLSDKEKPLAIYVSFGKYYHLEPLLFRAANALNIFHTWVLSKIIIECVQLADAHKINILHIFNNEKVNLENIELFIEKAEKNSNLYELDFLIDEISIQKTINLIENLTEKLKRKRAILLLDDAALTLTPEYMVEFFDIFRSLKTLHISPKASVYPGTTHYGPRFHVGQDAEEVIAWLNVDDDSYNFFMNSIIEKRFLNLDFKNNEVLEVLKYAAFGIPRAFITLIRNYQQEQGSTTQQKFNTVISNQKELLSKEYLSLSLKLPQYKTIIQTGFEFFDNVISQFVEANNKNIGTDKKSHLGILEDEQSFKALRMIKFLVEAGLLYEINPLHDGPDRTYKRYIPHYLFLIQARAFSKTRGFNLKETIEIIQRKPDKRSLRRQLNTLLNSDKIDNIKLDLPACNKCGTQRISEDQKFCHHCGNPLVGHSAYEMALKLKIEELPLPNWQIARILKETQIQTVEDILMSQSPATELKKAKFIGDKRSSKIYSVVTNYLDEFLG